jgi:hypothetical protein
MRKRVLVLFHPAEAAAQLEQNVAHNAHGLSVRWLGWLNTHGFFFTPGA